VYIVENLDIFTSFQAIMIHRQVPMQHFVCIMENTPQATFIAYTWGGRVACVPLTQYLRQTTMAAHTNHRKIASSIRLVLICVSCI
jgi:hypothetical protein